MDQLTREKFASFFFRLKTLILPTAINQGIYKCTVVKQKAKATHI